MVKENPNHNDCADHPENPKVKDVKALYEERDDVAVDDEGTIRYCPRTRNGTPEHPACASKSPHRPATTAAMLQTRPRVQPGTDKIRKTFQINPNVAVGADGTIYYCPHKDCKCPAVAGRDAEGK